MMSAGVALLMLARLAPRQHGHEVELECKFGIVHAVPCALAVTGPRPPVHVYENSGVRKFRGDCCT